MNNSKYKPITKEVIVESIKSCLSQNPKIKPTKLLVNSVFRILTGFYLEDKKYVICEFPTGSGKTIIGFMTYFCSNWLKNYQSNEENKHEPYEALGYFLTSSKILQDQIERDIDRFEYDEYMKLLKGVNNYSCLEATSRMKVDLKFAETVKNSFPNLGFAPYEFRPCKNYSADRLKELECFPICPYKINRLECSGKSLSVLNYAYFLNVLRTDFNPFFTKRELTICDEAHLIPDIICNSFNYEITPFQFSRLITLLTECKSVFGSDSMIEDLIDDIKTIQNDVFKKDLKFSNVFEVFKTLKSGSMKVVTDFKAYKNKVSKGISAGTYKTMYETRFDDLIETLDNFIENSSNILKLYIERREDIYYESEFLSTGYKHIIKDLSEHEMCRTHFLSKIDKGLFMSATLGDGNEYASMMGMNPNEYILLSAPSQFDFSSSPIYLCNIGKLNYASMEQNLPRVIRETVSVCLNKHPNEKGVIHTSTFSITNALREFLLNSKQLPQEFKSRFLFYSSSLEREEVIKTFLASKQPLILVGPSLYEGLDLKDDLARFQILIKVPYAQLNDYIKLKMKRYPFWYQRNCKEKIIQAIGRSNRHVNDWSSIYLMDSLFGNIIFETNETIINRLKSYKS